MINPLMPAGASSLERLPSLMEGGLSDYELLRSEPTEQQLDEYSGAVRKTANVFSSMQVKAGTVAERDKYVVWVDACASSTGSAATSCWMRRCAACVRGFVRCARRAWLRNRLTSLCVIVCVAQKAPGDPGFALPVMLEKGRAKVLRPEVLAGMLLEMGTGAIRSYAIPETE